MTTLLVEKLINELSTTVNYSGEGRIHVGSIAPYLYLHNPSADYFTLKVIKDSVEIASVNATVSQIKSSFGAVDNFAHVFYPFITLNPIQIEKGTYIIKLIAGPNYVNNESSFMGWIKQHEDIQNETSYTPSDDSRNPLAYRMKIYKEGIL